MRPLPRGVTKEDLYSNILPEEEQNLLQKHFMEGKTQSEIAEEQGTTQSEIQEKVRVAVEKIRESKNEFKWRRTKRGVWVKQKL